MLFAERQLPINRSSLKTLDSAFVIPFLHDKIINMIIINCFIQNPLQRNVGQGVLNTAISLIDNIWTTKEQQDFKNTVQQKC